MKRFWMLVAVSSVSAIALRATPPPTTPTAVIAKVDSYEHYRAFRGERFSLQTPYGNDAAIVATIVSPESLAGREIAIPFESKDEQRELLVQRGTTFRFEHRTNLADLRKKTDAVRRRAIAFPEFGLQVLNPEGEVVASYDGALSGLKAAREKKAEEPR